LDWQAKPYTWTDLNGDGIPQINEWLPNGAATVSVGASGGSSTHINTNMSRPYSEQISAGYDGSCWATCVLALTITTAPRKPDRNPEHAVSPSDYVPITTLEAHRFSIRSLASR